MKRGENLNYTDLILAIYTMMLIFAVYMGYKIFKARMSIKGPRRNFYQRTKISLYILMSLLIFMIYASEGIYLKLVLVGLLIYISYTIIEKITFFDQGIYFNGTITEYKDIRSWTFNEKNSNLIVRLSAKDDIRIYPVRKPDREEVNKIIKDHKQKSKKK